MNPNNTPINEPNFDGEEMKVPEAMQAVVETNPNTSLVSGPILILLFAILAALLGGIYYWYTILMSEPLTTLPTRPTAEMNNEPESTTAEARTDATDVVSTSDELDALQADIESTRFDDIDDGFAAIETEIGGALEATETPPPVQ
jgi:zona occludens toxin (predicted ATPase)